MGKLISGRLVVDGVTLWSTSRPGYVLLVYKNILIHPSCPGLQTNQKRVLFDVGKDGAKLASKSVVPDDQQEPNESRRLWRSLTEAIVNKDMDGATNSKTAVEEAQRENRRKLEEKGEKHVPRFFEEKNGAWVPKLECVSPIPLSKYTGADLVVLFRGSRIPTQPTQEVVDAVEKWIWGTSMPPP